LDLLNPAVDLLVVAAAAAAAPAAAGRHHHHWQQQQQQQQQPHLSSRAWSAEVAQQNSPNAAICYALQGQGDTVLAFCTRQLCH